MPQHRYSQVDVFGAEPFQGNPVAVVHAADGLSDEEMALFARWTNFSETTYLMTPTVSDADYRLRIFTPAAEIPFAGHPTLGSAHAWLQAEGKPQGSDLVQQCGAGLVTVRTADRLSLAAPPLIRSGPVGDSDLSRIVRALRIGRDDIVEAAWVDNGAGWVAVLLRDAGEVLDLRPDFAAFGELEIGVVGAYPSGVSEAAVEVRAFVPAFSHGEDPVTGSLNAGIAQWLAGTRLPASYVASQGTVLGRKGRVDVETDSNGQIWIGGETRTRVLGTALFEG